MTTSIAPKYPHIVRAVFERPWAILPSTLSLIVDILRFRAEGGVLSDDEVRSRIGAASNGPRRGGGKAAGGAVAVIPIYGVIANHSGDLRTSGATTVDEIRADFRDALANEDVCAIVFDVDSPGGSVDGIEELAAEIRAARGQKPMSAVANVQMDSAAYYLGAQADEVVATPSGRVGSIGVIAAHQDISKAAEAEGVKTTLISAGKFKTEGNRWEPLSEEARAFAQSQVDEFYGMFVDAVAKGRGVTASQVRSGYGEGRELLAKSAKSAGLVDRIDTLENTIRRASAGRIVMRTGAQALASRAYIVGESGPEPFVGLGSPVTAVPYVAAAEIVAGPIGIHHGTTDNGPFDGPAQEAAMPNTEGEATFRRMYAWADPNGNPDAKASYRFIHHFWRGAPGPASTRGCSAGIGVINGARGGTTIPDADKPGVHAHLAAHMHDAGMEPSPMNGASPAGSGSGLPFHARLEAVTAETEELVAECEKRSAIRATEGRDLSAATRGQLALLGHRIETLLASAPVEPSDADRRAQVRARLAVLEAAARAGYRLD